MCEIAIIDTEDSNTQLTTNAAIELYNSMRDSLGIVAVQADEERDKFNYEVYKSVEPDHGEVFSFIEEHYDETRWFIIHGRLATKGDVTEENAHPIEIDCEKCNIDYVIHNGMVMLDRRYRRENEEHNYTTPVDSESIAHEYGDVPDEFDDISGKFSTEPCFILLNEDRIYVYTNGKYVMDGEMSLACSHRPFAPDRSGSNIHHLIATPN